MSKAYAPVDIILSTWNRPAFTRRVIRAIRLNTLSLHRLIVIDNGSDPETIHQLKSLEEAGMIDCLCLLGVNRGLEFSRQLGLSLVRSERFVTTDSDCLPHKPYHSDAGPSDWLYVLNGIMDRNPDYAAIACRTQVMIGSGDIFGEHPPEIVDFTCGGSLRLMNTEVIRKLGGWDRAEALRGNEEHYICNKIREAGFQCGFASYIPCYHLFGTSGTSEKNGWGYEGLTPQQSGHRSLGNLPIDDTKELTHYE